MNQSCSPSFDKLLLPLGFRVSGNKIQLEETSEERPEFGTNGGRPKALQSKKKTGHFIAVKALNSGTGIRGRTGRSGCPFSKPVLVLSPPFFFFPHCRSIMSAFASLIRSSMFLKLNKSSVKIVGRATP